MGKNKKILILIFFFFCSFVMKAQEDTLNFREAEKQSLELYRSGQWKELAKLANKALSQGIDYYYLRLRAGIAFYEMKRYARASVHFKAALEFNENDPLALEYLYECYLELNQQKEAYETYLELPPSSKERLKKSLPRIRMVSVEEAYLDCNQVDKFDSLDLDGKDNLYGEADLSQDGHYFSALMQWGFKKGYSAGGAYSFVKVNKDKIAKISDTLSVDDQYPVKQHQFYLNGIIPLGNGFSAMPAVTLLFGNYDVVMPKLSSDSVNYMLPVETFSYTSYIASLSVTKDFTILKTTLFASYSDLNSERQFQGGVQAIIYPFGNLDFYLTSKLIDHLNEEENSIIFDQMIGGKLFRNTWGEVDATFGKLINYYENNGFVVYNITDDIKFKGSAKLMYFIYPHWTITGEYAYLLRDGFYTYYSIDEAQKAVPVTVNKEYSNNIFLLGLNWKF